jgi:hypothetical protein
MATTITTQRRGMQAVLQDYNIHHSAPITKRREAEQESESRNRTISHSNWGAPYRRVPSFRPTNRDRDQSEIGAYTSAPERIFISTMFTGVFINAVGDLQTKRGMEASDLGMLIIMTVVCSESVACDVRET